MTCSQVWDRLASNEEHQNPISPKPVSPPTTSLPTHISFSYDPSDDDDEEEEEEDLSRDDKNDFQYVPVSSQSKLVQFQFLTFVRQQQLNIDNDGNDENNKEKQYYDSDDDEDEDEEQEDTLVDHPLEDNEEEQEVSVVVVKDIFTSDIVYFRIDHLRNANDQYPRRIPSMVFLLFLQQTMIQQHPRQRLNNHVPKNLKSKIRMPISNF